MYSYAFVWLIIYALFWYVHSYTSGMLYHAIQSLINAC